jgi:hypothetical protein
VNESLLALPRRGKNEELITASCRPPILIVEVLILLVIMLVMLIQRIALMPYGLAVNQRHVIPL